MALPGTPFPQVTAPPYSGRPMTALDIAAAGGDAYARSALTGMAQLIAGLQTTVSALSATVAALGTIAPVLPSFVRQPSITGNTLVGSVDAFDPGSVVNGTIATIRLFKDGVDFADASALSYQWAAPGTYFIRVTVANSSVKADSPAVVVTAPAATGITAPSIYFDSARVAGTNPPIVYFDEPDNTSLATDQIEGVQVNGGVTKTMDVASSIALMTNGSFTYSDFDNDVAGPWSFYVRLKRTVDADGNAVNPPIYSPPSNVLTDTLNDKALPPASTTWDQNNKFTLVTLSNSASDETGSGDGSNVSGGIDSAGQSVISTQSRSDTRYFEVTLTHQFASGSQYGGEWVVGVCPDTSQITGPGFAPGFNGGGHYFGYGDAAVGDVISFLITPSTDGSKNGNCQTWKNGSPSQNDAHPYKSYKIWSCTDRDQTIRLNTGQTPFAYPNLIPSGVKRFN